MLQIKNYICWCRYNSKNVEKKGIKHYSLKKQQLITIKIEIVFFSHTTLVSPILPSTPRKVVRGRRWTSTGTQWSERGRAIKRGKIKLESATKYWIVFLFPLIFFIQVSWNISPNQLPSQRKLLHFPASKECFLPKLGVLFGKFCVFLEPVTMVPRGKNFEVSGCKLMIWYANMWWATNKRCYNLISKFVTSSNCFTMTPTPVSASVAPSRKM